MTNKTKTLQPLRLKIAKKLKVGSARLTFTTEAVQKARALKNRCWPSSLVEQILSKKMYQVAVKKKRSYKIYYGRKLKRTYTTLKNGLKVQNKRKPIHSLNYLLRRKMVTQKDLWIRKVRQMRKFLKDHKSQMSTKYYRSLRQKVKGNVFESIYLLRNYYEINKE